MQCENCKKTAATIHLTEIVEGKRHEMHLCELCAQKEGLAAKAQMPLSELLNNLLAGEAEPELLKDASAEKMQCPNCGITMKQFLKNSSLGCPYDYELFGKFLQPIIEKSHAGKTTHCGKIPSKAPGETKKQSELSALRRELQAAVREENYEAAAKLRDRINQLLDTKSN